MRAARAAAMFTACAVKNKKEGASRFGKLPLSITAKFRARRREIGLICFLPRHVRPPEGLLLPAAGQFTFWQKTLCAKWKSAKCRQRRKQQVGFEEAARLARLKGRGNRNAATVQCRRRPLGGKARSAAKLSQKRGVSSFLKTLGFVRRGEGGADDFFRASFP